MEALLLFLDTYTVKAVLIAAVSVAMFLDFVTTRLAIRSGAGKETNPIIRKVIEKFGFNGLLAIKIGSVVTTLVTGMATQGWVLGVLALIYWPVVINNYRIYREKK